MYPILHELMPPSHSNLIPQTINHNEDSMDLSELDLLVETGNLRDRNESNRNPIQHWVSSDICDWLIKESENLGVCYGALCGERFVRSTGPELMKMTEENFKAITHKYGGHLYNSIRRIEKDSKKLDTVTDFPKPEKSGTSSSLEPQSGEKRRRGRPKNPNRKGKKKPEKFGRLWEFLRELLKNKDFCPSVIKWENHDEGMFRFVQSDKVAKIWGTRKGNLGMSYEKLSRAMRYYYRSQVLLPVIGRRLVYKFGPKATGWRVDDPNFEKVRSRTEP